MMGLPLVIIREYVLAQVTVLMKKVEILHPVVGLIPFLIKTVNKDIQKFWEDVSSGRIQ